MDSRIKGITIEIGGDTSGLDKALKGTNKEIASTQSELRDVERLLKLDPTNTILLKQKQELLAKSVNDTGDKLKTLKIASEQAASSAKKYDEWKTVYDPIQSEITETKKRLEELKAQQKEALETDGKESEVYKSLQESIRDTYKELKELKKQAEAVTEEFGNPISQKQYDALQREVAATEIAMRNLENQSKDTNNAIKRIDEGAIEDVADAAEEASEKLIDAGKEASNFEQMLKAGIIIEGAKGAAEAIKEAAEESKEYMKIMGSLEISSKQAGYTAEETAQTYEHLYGILADDQTAATTTANLQAIGLSQEQLIELTNMSIGAWAKYGDSIPIDGLAEAINETVKAGQVTGGLADVLNWGTAEGEMFGLTLKENIDFTEKSAKELKKMSKSQKAEYEARKEQHKAIEDYNTRLEEAVSAEDKFNIALENASTEEERANLILQALAKQGLADSGVAWQENNEALIENNQAQAEMQEQVARLGETVMPVFTEITEIVASALEWFNNLDEGQQKNILTAIALVTGFGIVITTMGNIVEGIQGLSGTFNFLAKDVIPAVGNAFSTVFSFIAAHPVVLLIAAIVGLVALIAAKGEEIQNILKKVDDFFQNVFATDFTEVFGPILGDILNGFAAHFKNIWDSIKHIANGFIDFVRGVFTGDWKRAWNGIGEIILGVCSGIAAKIISPINKIIGVFNGLISGVNELIRGLNNIKFDIPDWLGGGKFKGFNLKTIGKIPYLAKGGILTDGTAIVGEAGPEILTINQGKAVVQPLTGSAVAGSGLNELMGLLESYLPYLALGKQIVLDTGVLVGETAPMYNDEFGKIAKMEKYQ